MTTQQQIKMDAGGRYLEQELTKLELTKFWVEYPAKKARSVFPIDTSVGKGFKKYKYKQYDRTGIAKILNSKASDIPKLNVYAQQFEGKVHEMGIGQDFTWQDLDEAAQNGDSLDTEFLTLARQAHIFTENDTAFFGDAENGLDGLTINANVPTTASSNGAAGSPLWTGASSKTAAEVYADVAQLIDLVNSETLGTHIANAVMFPLSARAQLNQVFSTLSGKSVLAQLKENFPEIKMWEFVNELETAGTGDTRIMYAYDMSVDVLRMIVPFETEPTPPVAKETGYTVVARMGIAGLNIRKPLAIQGLYGF